MSASSSRSMYGVCVVDQTSTRPSTTRAVPASGSMYACSTNDVSNVPVAVTVGAGERRVHVAAGEAAADEDVARPVVVELRRRRVEAGRDPQHGRQHGPGDRQLVVPDPGDDARVADEREDGLPGDSGRCRRRAPAGPCRSRRSRSAFSPGTSAAVSTRTSPGCAATNASRSPSSKVARACGERTTRSVSAPVSKLSSANCSAPVTLATPSSRAIRAPTADPAEGAAGGAARRASVPGACRLDRLHDLRVARAPAQHAAQPVEDVGVGRRRRAGEQVVRGHEHPRRAGAALRPAAGEERGLERRRRAARARQPLDGGDGPAIRLPDGHEARADLLPVEPDRARAAVARVAADLRPGQPEVLAQHVDQPPAPVGDERVVDAVDGDERPGRRRPGSCGHRRDRPPDERQRGVPPVRGRPAHVVDRATARRGARR